MTATALRTSLYAVLIARNTKHAKMHVIERMIATKGKTMIIKEIGKVLLVGAAINAPFWACFMGWI